jgi:hypothetical protein
MKLGRNLVIAFGATLVATTAMADPQTHGADYKMRGMTESRSLQSRSYNYSAAPVVVAAPAPSNPAPSVAQQPAERRSYSVEPSAKSPCAPQPVSPAPVAKLAPQATERRAMSVEPAPVQAYNYAPSYQYRTFDRGAPYLRADSKARGY